MFCSVVLAVLLFPHAPGVRAAEQSLREARPAPARFEGNQKVRAATLRTCLGPDGTGRVTWAGRSAAAMRLNACYYDRGMIDVRIHEPVREVSRENNTVTLFFRIEEGPVYRLGRIAFSGEMIAATEHYRSRVAVEPGEVFSRSRIRQAIEDLDRFHAIYGCPDLSVEPQVNIDLDARLVHMTFVAVRQVR